MTVTHNGKQYTAKKLTLNRWQMHIAGLLEQVEVKV